MILHVQQASTGTVHRIVDGHKSCIGWVFLVINDPKLCEEWCNKVFWGQLNRFNSKTHYDTIPLFRISIRYGYVINVFPLLWT